MTDMVDERGLYDYHIGQFATDMRRKKMYKML